MLFVDLCNSCQGSNLIDDVKSGDVVCFDCGLVKYEKSVFEYDRNTIDNRLYVEMKTTTSFDRVKVKPIMTTTSSSLFHQEDYNSIHRKYILEIQHICEYLRKGDQLEDVARDIFIIYKKSGRHGNMANRNLVFVAIWLALDFQGEIYSLNDLKSAFNFNFDQSKIEKGRVRVLDYLKKNEKKFLNQTCQPDKTFIENYYMTFIETLKTKSNECLMKCKKCECPLVNKRIICLLNKNQNLWLPELIDECAQCHENIPIRQLVPLLFYKKVQKINQNHYVKKIFKIISGEHISIIIQNYLYRAEGFKR